jgi:hypothetical protein
MSKQEFHPIRRRWELLAKEFAGTLTPIEVKELAILQLEARKKTRLNSYGNKSKTLRDEASDY